MQFWYYWEMGFYCEVVLILSSSQRDIQLYMKLKPVGISWAVPVMGIDVVPMVNAITDL